MKMWNKNVKECKMLKINVVGLFLVGRILKKLSILEIFKILQDFHQNVSTACFVKYYRRRQSKCKASLQETGLCCCMVIQLFNIKIVKNIHENRCVGSLSRLYFSLLILPDFPMLDNVHFTIIYYTLLVYLSQFFS